MSPNPSLQWTTHGRSPVVWPLNSYSVAMKPLALTVASLRELPHLALLLARWYQDDSPDYFRGRSEADIAAEFFAVPARSELPLVLVALSDGSPCGTIALRQTSVTIRPHLSPWLAGLYVPPSLRGRGIGRFLLDAGEAAACKMGISVIYTGTSTANTMLVAREWLPLEEVEYHGHKLTLYRKLLAA